MLNSPFRTITLGKETFEARSENTSKPGQLRMMEWAGLLKIQETCVSSGRDSSFSIFSFFPILTRTLHCANYLDRISLKSGPSNGEQRSQGSERFKVPILPADSADFPRALLEEKRQVIGVLRWCVVHAKLRQNKARPRESYRERAVAREPDAPSEGDLE